MAVHLVASGTAPFLWNPGRENVGNIEISEKNAFRRRITSRWLETVPTTPQNKFNLIYFKTSRKFKVQRDYLIS
jgi:hypothetical protein